MCIALLFGTLDLCGQILTWLGARTFSTALKSQQTVFWRGGSEQYLGSDWFALVRVKRSVFSSITTSSMPYQTTWDLLIPFPPWKRGAIVLNSENARAVSMSSNLGGKKRRKMFSWVESSQTYIFGREKIMTTRRRTDVFRVLICCHVSSAFCLLYLMEF